MARDGWLAVAALNGLLAVAAGAFAAHGLEQAGADGRAAELARLGAQYQMWHALAMLGVRLTGGGRRVCGLFLAGIVLFSGSLYGLALGAPRPVAFVTPFGGLALLLGWAALAARALGLRARRRR